GVVDVTLLGHGRDHDGRDAGAVTPAGVGVGRSDMVPAAAVLVVGDDDRGVRPVGAALDGMHDVGDVLLARQQVGVAGVLVVLANRLDEADGGQVATGQVGEKVILVLEVGRRQRVLDHLPGLGVLDPGGEIVVVRQRLVVP